MKNYGQLIKLLVIGCILCSISGELLSAAECVATDAARQIAENQKKLKSWLKKRDSRQRSYFDFTLGIANEDEPRRKAVDNFRGLVVHFYGDLNKDNENDLTLF